MFLNTLRVSALNVLKMFLNTIVSIGCTDETNYFHVFVQYNQNKSFSPFLGLGRVCSQHVLKFWVVSASCCYKKVRIRKRV